MPGRPPSSPNRAALRTDRGGQRPAAVHRRAITQRSGSLRRWPTDLRDGRHAVVCVGAGSRLLATRSTRVRPVNLHELASTRTWVTPVTHAAPSAQAASRSFAPENHGVDDYLGALTAGCC